MPLTQILTGLLIITYLVLIVVLLTRSQRVAGYHIGLLVFSVFSALWVAAPTLLDLAVINIALTPYQIQLLGFVLSSGLLGVVTLTFLNRNQLAFLWGIFAALLSAGVLVAELMNLPSAVIESIPWLTRTVTLSVEAALGAWILLVLATILMIVRGLNRENRPLHRNRILLWALSFIPILIGDLLITWASPNIQDVGAMVRALGFAGMVITVTSESLLYLPDLMRRILSHFIVMLISGTLFAGWLWGVNQLGLDEMDPRIYFAALGGAGLLLAVIYYPLSNVLRSLMDSLFGRAPTDSAAVVKQYGQRISNELGMEALAHIIEDALYSLLGTTPNKLILVSVENGTATMKRADAVPNLPPGQLSTDGILYNRFITDKTPVLQYDIDYGSMYARIPSEEREFFTRQQMELYTPILEDNTLIGLLALGPKETNDLFTSEEKELLVALANQTVAALKNARLVVNLKSANEEIKTLNADLSQMNVRLEQLDQVKSEFVRNASRELRAPLKTIKEIAELLQVEVEQGAVVDQKLLEKARTLSEAAVRMDETISTMQDVSELDVESIDLEFEQISITSLLDNIVAAYRDDARARNLNLNVDLVARLSPINGDRRRLSKALQQLVLNAIRYTPDGGTVTITCEPYKLTSAGRPESIKISISDTGIGIARNQQEHVFEEFYRGVEGGGPHKPTDFKADGAGLGLTLAKGIITAHGGRIWLESDGYNEETLPGTTVRVTLPARPPAMIAQEKIKAVAQDTTTP